MYGGDRQPAGLRPRRAAVRYDDIARKLVHAFKYSDRFDLAPVLGHWMARAGRRLLLIDDVLTSSATVDACARALPGAEAAHVDVLVFARVVAPMRATI